MKKFILVLLFIAMLGMTIYASLYRSLVEGVVILKDYPWFNATILDFYINQFIIWCFAIYLLDNKAKMTLWGILFICFGSMATTLLILIYFKTIQNKVRIS